MGLRGVDRPAHLLSSLRSGRRGASTRTALRHARTTGSSADGRPVASAQFRPASARASLAGSRRDVRRDRRRRDGREEGRRRWRGKTSSSAFARRQRALAAARSGPPGSNEAAPPRGRWPARCPRRRARARRAQKRRSRSPGAALSRRPRAVLERREAAEEFK